MTTSTAAPPPPIADPLPALVGRAVPLGLAGWLLGGWVGLVAAAVGVASTFRRPVTLVAAGAPLMLVVSALATVIEKPIDDEALRSSFASDRPTAATAGLLAALFALVAVVTIAVRDRPAPAVPVAVAEPEGRPALRDRVLALAPLAGLVLATAVVLGLLAPTPPSATREVAANLRNGVGWGTRDDAALVVDATEPPLAVVVAAVAPGGARAWTALAGAAAVAVTGALVARRGDRRTVLLPAGLVALGLVVVRADLAAALAAAATAAALSAGDPDGRTPRSAAWAGAAYGLAVLAAPVLALALPFVVAALVVDPRTRDVSVPAGLAGLAAAVLVVTPWLRWVRHEFGTWSPSAELEWPARSLAAVLLVVLAAAVLPRLTDRRSTGS